MRLSTFLISILLGSMVSCIKDDPIANPMPDEEDLTDILYDPEPYDLPNPPGFPTMVIPSNNSITVQGFELGRRLFYDTKFSADSTMSCASCHLQENNFNDPRQFSIGVQGLPTPRSSMTLVNIGFIENGLFWDGRSQNLELQAIEPVINPIELFEEWDNVIQKIRTDSIYPSLFRNAFGISRTSEIDQLLITKAIAQFERSLISYNSKFDKFILQQNFDFEFTDSETRGMAMFFDTGQDQGLPDAECAHCHDAPLFTTGLYFNNGLDNYPSLEDYPDKGRGEVTQLSFDNGKFKTPSLRNIMLSAPYMHDSRFDTIEKVIEHYDSGGHFADNLDVNIHNLELTQSQKQDIINFLKTLTDTEFINNSAFANPFDE